MSSDDGSLAGRRAIVVGAGRNVGEAIAFTLAERGASIAVVDLDATAARQNADRLNGIRPGSAISFGCDVSNAAQVEEMGAFVWEELGGAEILVNSVAITDRGKTILDLSEEEWERVLRITLTGPFLTTANIARRMVDSGLSGAIVNIGSTSGHRPRANALAYPTAKAALYALSQSSALQLGPHGIRVNCVTPNKVGSPVGESEERAGRPRNNLIGRSCTPHDIANAVAFLVSGQGSFITGTDIVVDGGALIATAMD